MTPEEAGYVRSMKARMCQTCDYFQAPNTCNLPLSIPVDPILDCCNHWDPKDKESGDIIYLGAIKNAKTLNNPKGVIKHMNNCKVNNTRLKLAKLEKELPIEKRIAILRTRVARILQAEDYPWDKCIEDNMKEYGDKETAEKVCGSIKAKYGSYKAYKLAKELDKSLEELQQSLS